MSRHGHFASVVSARRGLRFIAVVFGALISCPSVLSCVRPAEDRVRLDARVGRAQIEGASVTVEGGLAVVRRFSRERLELWGNAPELFLAVTLSGGEPLELRIENCMPDAELRVREGQASIGAVATGLATQCEWEITPYGSALGLAVEVPRGESDGFEFALLSDIQNGIDEIQDVYRAISAEPGLSFVLSTGDLTSRGTRPETERFRAELAGLSIPFFTTIGNHELGESPPLFQQYFGRGSFHFDFRGVHFTMIDSASATVDPTVYEWLDGWLQHSLEDGGSEPHVVAMHIPPLDPIGVRNGCFASRAEAAKLLLRLADHGVDLTLYGHIHSYYAFQNAGIEAHISGGGGALPETFDGVGRHFMVVSMDKTRGVLGSRIVRVD